MSIFCPNCGSEMADDAKFCTNCGTANIAPSEPAPAVEAEPAAESASAVEPSYEEPTVAAYFEEAPASEPVVESAPQYNYQQNVYEQPQESKALSIVALICGILAIPMCCCGWLGIIVAIAAIVCGIISLINKKGGKGMAVAGIICGGLGLILSVIMTIASVSSAEALKNVDPSNIDSIYEMLEEYGIDM